MIEIDDLFYQLQAALAEARQIIRSFHGEPGWSDYQHSPEMKCINAALAAAYDVAGPGRTSSDAPPGETPR